MRVAETYHNQEADLQQNQFEDFTVSEVLKMGKEGRFPKKCMWFGKTVKYYRPALHFFSSIRVNIENLFVINKCYVQIDCYTIILIFIKFFKKFAIKPTRIEFTCRLESCSSKNAVQLQDLNNLNKHLVKHEEFRCWYKSYLESKDNQNEQRELPSMLVRFLKWFIDSNLALAQVENELLFPFLHPDLKLPSQYTFRYKLIPSLLDAMVKEINSKCHNAAAISIIPDGWTGQFSNTEYMGVAAQLIDRNFRRENIFLGTVSMNNGHCAEQSQIAIQQIFNKYSFDKKKIIGKICFYINILPYVILPYVKNKIVIFCSCCL